MLALLGWAAMMAPAMWLLGREDAHLKQTGLPARWRVSTAQALYVASGAVVLTFGTGWFDGGAFWRVLLIVGTVGLSYLRLRQVFSLPGADRLELALGAVADRKPVLLRAVLAVSAALLAVAVIVGFPFGGLPLLVGLAGLVASGWRPARTRQRTVAHVAATVANACRLRHVADVALEPKDWLAGSDDVLQDRRWHCRRTGCRLRPRPAAAYAPGRRVGGDAQSGGAASVAAACRADRAGAGTRGVGRPGARRARLVPDRGR